MLICVKDNGLVREFAIDSKVNLTDSFIESIKKLLGDESLIYFTK